VFTARHRARIHPGEWWLVVANAVAFGSGYVLGAWSMAFMLVLAVHHEVQYLFFTYAMVRRSVAARVGGLRGELRPARLFALWPMLGLTSWALCRLSQSDWVPPFLVGGPALPLLARRPHLDDSGAPSGRLARRRGSAETFPARATLARWAEMDRHGHRSRGLR
jgi:hypothetical protein